MSGNIKVTLSIPQETNLIAEKIGKEMHISKSEVYSKAMLLFAREMRKEKIRQAASKPEVINYYKNDLEVREWEGLDKGWRETI